MSKQYKMLSRLTQRELDYYVERLLRHCVETQISEHVDTPCMICEQRWLGTDGYSRMTVTSLYTHDKRWTVSGHRLVWAKHNGAQDEYHDVAHLCGVKACVNIDHLQAMPSAENKRMYRELGI